MGGEEGAGAYRLRGLGGAPSCPWTTIAVGGYWLAHCIIYSDS
jgi:hypothetical protein